MFIKDNISVITSKVQYSNVINTTLSFSLWGKHQTVFDCCLDTGCSTSLISANHVNFGMSLKDAQFKLFIQKEVGLGTGCGVEGRNVDKSAIASIVGRINNIKKYCIDNNLTDKETERLIYKNCRKDEYDIISRSLYVRYALPIKDVAVGAVNTKSFDIGVSFNTPDTVNLIGMSTIQNLYMETFSAYGNFYTLLTIPEKKHIDKVIDLGRQLRKKPTTVPY